MKNLLLRYWMELYQHGVVPKERSLVHIASGASMFVAQLVCRTCALGWVLFLVLGGTEWFRVGLAADTTADDTTTTVVDATTLAWKAVVGPWLWATTVAAIALQQRLPSRTATRATNWSWDFWAVTVLLPGCTLFVLCTVARHTPLATSWTTTVAHLANALAMVSVLALTVLLFPVTPQSPLVRIMGWNPATAVQLHVWLGRVVVMGALGHGLLHAVRWRVGHGENLATLMGVPPRSCWWDVESEALCISELSDCQCLALWRNFFGMLGALGLLLLMGAAFVRRRWYALFYHVHIVAGPLVVVATVLHWKRGALYLVVGLLTYLVCALQRRQDPTTPVTVKSVERIGDSSVALTLAATTNATANIAPGQYMQLAIPELSSQVAHPFSVSRVPHDNCALRVLIQSVGPWTKGLAQRLEQGQPCNMLVKDILGPHSENRIAQHDVLVCVAGGMGITPFLSLLLAPQRPSCTVVVHWICRDTALIEYIQREYSAVGRANGIQVVVHPTKELNVSDNITATTQLSYVNPPQSKPFQPVRICYATCVIALWTGVTGIWAIYRFLPVTNTFWPRALCLIWCGVCARIWSYIAQSTNGAAIDKLENKQVLHGEDLESFSRGSQINYGTNSQSAFELRPPGRPAIEELVEHLPAARSPGLWVCGPCGLVQDVKRAAQSIPSLAIYEEAFRL